MPPTTSPVSALPRLYPGGPQQDSITASTIVAAGQWFELVDDWNGVPTRIDWEIVYPVAPATVSVQLEGTDDPAQAAANVFVLDGPKTTVTNEKRFVLDRPVRFIRANLTVLTGASASVTVRLKNSGKG